MGVTAALTAVSLGVSLLQSRKAKKEAKKAQQADIAFDARSARLQAKALTREAGEQIIETRREGEELIKTQTARIAKAGVKIGRGTAADILQETREATARDISTTAQRAEREASRLTTTFRASGVGKLPTSIISKAERARKASPDVDIFGGVLGNAVDAAGPDNSAFIKSSSTNQSIFKGF